MVRLGLRSARQRDKTPQNTSH